MYLRRIIQIAAVAGVVSLVGACATLPVTTDVNPNTSAANCHTYAWAQEHVAAGAQPAAYGNPVNADRLRNAIAANLSAHGLEPAADRRGADCVIGYAIGSRVVADDFGGIGMVGMGWGGWGGWGGGWGPGAWGPWGFDYPYVHNEGRISVDLFDAHTRVAIWHASVDQNVVDLTGPAAELKIKQAAAAIFSKFPVGTAPAPPSDARGKT